MRASLTPHASDATGEARKLLKNPYVTWLEKETQELRRENVPAIAATLSMSHQR